MPASGKAEQCPQQLWEYHDYPDELFFTQLLNLDYAGLEQVRESAQTQDWARAGAALLDYYRQRQQPSLAPPLEVTTGGYSQETAERALQHEFTVLNYVMKCGKQINWRDRDFEGGFCIGHFNRMTFLRDLAGTYRETGDEKYAIAILDLLDQWIDNVPVVNPKQMSFLDLKASGWNPIDVADRAMHSWPPAILAALGSEQMTPKLLAKILKSIIQQIEFLTEHHVKVANHCTFEVGNIFMAGILWPEVSLAEDWREYGLRWLKKQANSEHYADGFTVEMSTGYQAAFRLLYEPYEFARHNGYTDLFAQDWLDVVHKGYRVFMYLRKPSGLNPRYNDGLGRDWGTVILEGGEVFDDMALRWVGSGGRRGSEPVETAYFFPDARYAIMRSGWGPDDDYLIMDCGPYGTNHRNPNQLAVEVCARGKNLIENPGYWRRTTSFPAPWFPMARWYGQDSRSQSTLNPVGTSQIGGDADGYMVVHPDFDYAVGWYEQGYVDIDDATHTRKDKQHIGLRHTRRVFYLTGEYWSVLDSLDGEGEYPVELHWHFLPGAAGLDEVTKECWAEQEGVRLFLRPAYPANLSVRLAEGQENPHAGWWSPWQEEHRHESLPAPEAIMQRGGELPVNFATLLCAPEGNEGGPQIASAKLEGQATGALTIEHEAGTDYLQVADGRDKNVAPTESGVNSAAHSQNLGGLQAEAELIFVRVDAQGEPTQALLARPRRISWRGQELWQSDEPPDTLALHWADGQPRVKE